MKNYTGLLIGFVVLILFFGAGIFYVGYYQNRDKGGYVPPSNITDKSSGNDSEQNVTTVEVDNDLVRLVKVDAVDGNIISYTRDGASRSVAMNSDEIVLACTSQALGNIQELDFDLVSRINVVSPSFFETYTFGPNNVVLFVEDKNGIMTVHSIAMGDEDCDF